MSDSIAAAPKGALIPPPPDATVPEATAPDATVPEATVPETSPAVSRQSFFDRPIASFASISWEHAVWFALVVVALILRLYDLGARGMSHDESLHTQYAYNLYFKGVYEHNPMMHGPFRYHLTALAYYLFGDNDFTSRLVPALFGTALVAVMYAFRRYIGRTGALFAAIFITVSPSLLFHSRYIRDDIFIATFTTLWALFALRYIESHRKLWLYLLVATMGFSFSTMENSFITGAIFGGFFLMYALYEVISWRVFAILVPLIPGGILGYYYHYLDQDNIALPVVAVAALIAIVVGLFFVLRTEGWWNKLRHSLAADLCVLMATLVLPFLSPFIHVLLGGEAKIFAEGNYQDGEIVAKLVIYVSMCVVASAGIAVGWFGFARKGDNDGRIGILEWLQMMAIFWAINILFFTTFFTNARKGLATGVVGSLGYWLAQQHVERGSQPWYYYPFIGGIYEFLPILLSVFAGLSTFYAILRRHPIVPVGERDLPKNDPTVHSANGEHFRGVALALIFSWTLGMWFAYTVAGEKMPWLLTHMALPMCVLGGWWLARFLLRQDWHKARESGALWLIILTPILILLAVLAFSALPETGRTTEALSSWMQSILTLLALAAAIFLTVRWFRRAGWRLALSLVATGVFALLFVLNVRASFMLTYVNYDMATEYLVYAHASPDVKRAIAEITEISERTVGDKNIVVAYDDDASWPLSWYFREFPNAKFYGDNPSSDAMAAPIILVSEKNREKVVPYVERDYVKTTYRRIWWPDMDYFNLTPARVWNAITDPQQRERLAQIFFFRRHRDTNDFSRFRDLMDWPARAYFDMWVRRDLAAQIWDLNVTPGVVTEVANPLANVEEVDLSASAIYQSTYNGSPLVQPRAVAIAPNGNRIIADTGNHRIVVLDSTGAEQFVFGNFCNLGLATASTCVDPDGSGPLQIGDGQFNEPWGVAADSEGNMYVSDTWNGRIQKFDAQGNFLAKWGYFNSAEEGGDAMALYGPRGIDVDLAGNVIVADTGNKRIVRFTPSGEAVNQFGGGGVIEGRFDEPTDVAVDPGDGSVFVADAWNHRVQKFTPSNEFMAEWPVPGWESQDIYAKPSITVAANGDLYATDPKFYRVFVYSPDGTLKATFGRYGTDANRFGLPNGIAADLVNGTVLVADADNARIMVFPNVP